MTRVIKFYANWCGPCKRYGPIFEEVRKENKDNNNIQFYEVNVDKDDKKLASKFKVESIPTTVIITSEGVATKYIGELSKEEISKLIKVI